MISNSVTWSDFKPWQTASIESAIRSLKRVVPETKKEHIEILAIESATAQIDLKQLKKTFLEEELPHDAPPDPA